MSIKANFDIIKAKKYLDANEYRSLSDCINNAFKIQRNNNGELLVYEFHQEQAEYLLNLLSLIVSSKLAEKYNDVLKEVFRALRTCVLNPNYKFYLAHNGTFLNNVTITVKTILERKLDNNFMQVILQFLINITVLNRAAALLICDKFIDIVLPFLDNNICIYETTALIYNISLYKTLDSFDFDFYKKILDLYENINDIEFLQFLIETFLTYEKFWGFYKDLSIPHHIKVLETIKDFQTNSRKLNLPQNGLGILAKHFATCCTLVFKRLSEKECLLPYEVCLLLEVLASFSSDENYLKLLQKDKDLLITCCVVLLNVHQSGKKSNNYFTIAKNLSEINNEDIKNHPAYCFKVNLVRIIGNLCWKNELAQNLMREAEIIPVLLECCNIDAKNPFIMQWAIFAIRNLCENNSENQAIIANLHKEGTVTSSVLSEIGITFNEAGGNKITLVPIERLKK